MTFFKLVFISLMFLFSLMSRAQQVENIDSGYSLELNAPSGQTNFIEFTGDYLFQSVLISFELETKFESVEWPPALNIQLENFEKKAILLSSLQKPSNLSSYVFETSMWVDDKKFPEPMTVKTPFTEEMEMSLKIVIKSGENIEIFVNDKRYLDALFPIEVDKITVGLQSAKGKVIMTNVEQ